jgi:hypothetical protein
MGDSDQRMVRRFTGKTTFTCLMAVIMAPRWNVGLLWDWAKEIMHEIHYDGTRLVCLNRLTSCIQLLQNKRQKTHLFCCFQWSVELPLAPLLDCHRFTSR